MKHSTRAPRGRRHMKHFYEGARGQEAHRKHIYEGAKVTDTSIYI